MNLLLSLTVMVNGILLIAQKFLALTAKVKPRKQIVRAWLERAIALILEDRGEDALRGLPNEAILKTVVVE